MKICRLLPIAAALALAVSCEKPSSEADKNAQVEREVQQRLAAERQADEQQRLAQQQADLDAREKALAAKETSPAAAAEEEEDDDTTAVPTPRATPRIATSSSSSSSKDARSYDTFYRKLEPYGAWRESADYGYVFQPRQAQQRNWRPYTDGRWAYTDAGWTWVSDEPFGWATYHYGRWTRLTGVGWVWVPGDEWAPAWVSWRKGEQNVGWAPLPPEARFERRTGIKKWADSYYDIDADEYVFIPNEEIGSEHLERSVIPAERNVTIVTQTTNVTNLSYNNTTIVNEGPNYEELRGGSRQPLERMRIERRYAVEEDQAPQPTIRGGVISVLAPLFAARASEAPRSVGPAIKQTTVARNWASGGNRAAAESARAKMKAEATPPSDAPPKSYEKPAVSASTPAPALPLTSASAQPTATPVATAAATASATTAPSAATPSPTPRPRPSLTPTATPVPVAPPTPTPPPVTTPVPTATPSSTVTATATPLATPVSTPAPAATASLAPSVPTVPRATATPSPAPTAATEESPLAGVDPRGPRGADKADRERRRNDLPRARAREIPSSIGASPAAAAASETLAAPALTPTPRAVAPGAAATPEALSPLNEGTPALKRKLTTPPPAALATVTPPAAQPTPTPTPSPSPVAESAASATPAEAVDAPALPNGNGKRRDKKAKRALEPGSATDVADPETSPKAPNEP